MQRGRLGPGPERVRQALEARGFRHRIVELEKTARSAAEAAEALSCEVGQIVKSLVFRGSRTGRPVLVVASGANRVDERQVGELLGEPVEKADAAFVKEKTGFSIGGVPPLGHVEEPVALVDEDLMRYGKVWAAAGHTHAVFSLHPRELVEMTGGRVAQVKGG
ncbi:hypothetical protein Rxycam_01077 [Rubrobacter xylanophilus DSM 9941]|uniref:YbaK/EbsC family protein n=1 Tax=Rubrobacter xylanophilus TaxID=49319 RepID=UPI001C63D675|nr:YbaK/EbsC family protein [Rubrobacter xylanophilus]QYJ15262.1 hypothetical protein Rxycam_01077 [Rubrobacter xylanophilus DSM 9941]